MPPTPFFGGPNRKRQTWLATAVIEAFGGSIRQFRASRKRKAWLATAASLAPEKAPLGLPEPSVSQIQEPVWHVSTGLKRLEAAPGSFGPVEKESLGLPQPRVWHQKRNHFACQSPSFRSSKNRFGTFWRVWSLWSLWDLWGFWREHPAVLGHWNRKALACHSRESRIRQFRASRKRKPWLATAVSFCRKRKPWLATAASLAPEKEPLGLPQPLVRQLQQPVWHVSTGLKRLKGLGQHPAVSGQYKKATAVSLAPEK